MISGLIYVVRAVAAFVIGAVGLILLAAVLFSKDRSAWQIGVSSVFVLAGFLAWPRRAGAWRHDPPTEKQLAFARDLGIVIPKGTTKGELSELISQAKAIRDAF